MAVISSILATIPRSPPLTGDTIRAQVGVQLVGEGEQLAEGLVESLCEGHAARRRLAGQQAVLPRGLASKCG